MKPLAPFALLLLFLVAASPMTTTGDVKKMFPDADKIKAKPGKLSKESREKIGKALGTELDAKENGNHFTVRAAVPILGAEKMRLNVLFFNYQGARLGVAVSPGEQMIAKVGVLKDGGHKALQNEHFLEQFEGFLFSDAIYSSPDDLKVLRKKAEGKGEVAELLTLFLRIGEEMRKVEDLWEEIEENIEKKDVSAGKGAEKLAEVCRTIEGISRAVPFYNDGQQKRFNKWMQHMRTGLGELKKEVEKRDFEVAQKKMFSIGKESCSRCHASAQNKFARERKKVGLGNGLFDLKIDVVNPVPAEEELMKGVFAAIRKAVLILEEGK